MSCPTCDHTLEGIGHGLFHCPRCGTLVMHPRVLLTVPKLVTRDPPDADAAPATCATRPMRTRTPSPAASLAAAS